MTSHNFAKYIVRCLGLILITFTLFSCTYDYFEDENNLRIYVPQIKEGEITNFYIAFHDLAGNHILTRTLEAPFNQNELIKEGILRFKMRPGDVYITCFAEYEDGSVTEGYGFAESFKAKEICIQENYPHSIIHDGYYELRKTNPRILQSRTQVYPIGHPGSADTIVLDIDKKQRFKGKIEVDIIDLPDVVTRIDIAYNGLGTRMKFDNYVGRHGNGDCIFASCDVTSLKNGNKVSINDHLVYPSAGYEFAAATRSVPANSLPLEIYAICYDANNSVIGTFGLTNDEFMALPDSKKPVDEDGNPVQSLILESQQTIKFTFKGFTIFGIDLEGWGDTEHGTVTPM